MRHLSFGTAFLFFVLVFASSGSASAQRVDCRTVTDDQLVETLMTAVGAKYADQMEHINIRSKDRVVTLEGWATTKKVRSDIEKIIKKTKCVKKVVNRLTIGVGGGCGPGTKPCGTICIPIDETCNIGKGSKGD
ncbi:MAG: BON domain-containing protein [Acidobacteriota bacterium]|nr:MAG: BON domain-containing protein [Acidobacteriota bacterium]